MATRIKMLSDVSQCYSTIEVLIGTDVTGKMLRSNGDQRKNSLLVYTQWKHILDEH